MRILTLVILATSLALGSCGGDSKPAEKQSATAPAAPAANSAAPAEDAPDAQDQELAASKPLELHDNYSHFLEPKLDDLDGMVKRRSIRVLVV